MYRKLLALTAAILLTYGAEEAFTYTLWIPCGGGYVTWPSFSYTPSASSADFPVGPWRDALAYVVGRWNANPSSLGFSISYDDPSVGRGNGESEVWWEPGPGAPAITEAWYDSSTCTFTEADIVFDNNEHYHYTTSKTSLWPYWGAYRPFQTTAMHEFGHGGGLGHTANTYSIMGTDWEHLHTNGSTARAYPGEDASAGLVALYGLWSGAPEDVGVVHWRRIGNNGEYSTHSRTRILNSSGSELPKTCTPSPTCREPVYKVKRGQAVQLELTYENLGKSCKTVAVGYYLSTNDTIATSDRFLGSSSQSLCRNTASTVKKKLTIPTNLTSGRRYYLGAIVDYTGALSEAYEHNNATYVGIRVQ